VTGVDLTAEAVGPQVTNRDVQPSVHLRRRLEVQQAQKSSGDAGNFGSSRRLGAGRNGVNGGSKVAASRAAGTRGEMEFSEEF
jgi:hypothetical protein